MSNSAAQIAFAVQYQIAPIVLTGGVAATQPGGRMPIVYITDGNGSLQGLASISSIDAFFAKYLPLPGGTLVQTQAATYPFANQTVAANAIIQQPLTISMLMIAPATNTVTLTPRHSKITGLIQKLTQHNSLGGLYDVITPAYTYTNCILTGMRDVTSGDSKQVQILFQLDFTQPLVTLAAAQAAQNSLMTTIGNGAAGAGVPPTLLAPATSATSIPQIGNILNVVTGPSFISNIMGPGVQ